MAGGLANSRHAPPEWHRHPAQDGSSSASSAAPTASEPTRPQSRHRGSHQRSRHRGSHHERPTSSSSNGPRQPRPSSPSNDPSMMMVIEPTTTTAAAATAATVTPEPTIIRRGSTEPSSGQYSTPHPQNGTPTPPSTTTATLLPTTTTKPPPPAPSAAQQRPAPHHELARYTKIMRRLQWKLPFLAQGYRMAVDHRVGARDPTAVAEAELMFKLDFFEYYMLIERALVHLLGVFGIDVPRGGPPPPPPNDAPPAEGDHHPSLSASRWGGADAKRAARHRYHANVLAALDNPDNPLHAALGTGEVRVQLGRAKDLRNRWKTAGDPDEEEEEERQRQAAAENNGRTSRSPVKRGGSTDSPEWRSTKKVAAPLDSYRLEHMLEVIFGGLGEAFKIAEARVRGAVRWGDEDDEEMLEALDWTAATEDERQWEFMVEAMDWEAV
ncbi:hypothetical protein VTJ04DRAFT_7757 [Mycothermus thermophilus]|uniref:uncharacterized protein n=1 Tax=Humicola insolens TaxID=85995 RepID=UPI00374281A1